MVSRFWNPTCGTPGLTTNGKQTRGTSSRGRRISESGRNAAGRDRNQDEDQPKKTPPPLRVVRKRAAAKQRPQAPAGRTPPGHGRGPEGSPRRSARHRRHRDGKIGGARG